MLMFLSAVTDLFYAFDKNQLFTSFYKTNNYSFIVLNKK